MLEFYPMEGDNDVGFVEVPLAFENWLIAVSGISFEDVSLAVLGEDNGDIELIMDYDDYMNLCDLYYEYESLGWLVISDPEYMDEINAPPQYDAEDVKVPVPTPAGGEMVEWSEIAGVFLDSAGFPVMFVSTKSLGDENPLDWIHLLPNAVTYTTMSDWDAAPSVKEKLQKYSHLLTAETFASTDWDESSWAEGFVDDLYAGDADENMYLDLYVNWASGSQSPTFVSDALWDTVYEWWHSMSENEKEAVIDESIFTRYYNDALEGYGDYEPEPYYDEDEWGPDDGFEAEHPKTEWQDFIPTCDFCGTSGPLSQNLTNYQVYCAACREAAEEPLMMTHYSWRDTPKKCSWCMDKIMEEYPDEMSRRVADYVEGSFPVDLEAYCEAVKAELGLGYEAETFEAPYAGLGALFKFGDNQSALGGFTAKELTESSAIHGDFDSASLNYSGKQNIEVRQGENFDAHARYNTHRFSHPNNPRNKISQTRQKLKKQMWTDTTATVGVKGVAAIIAAVAVGAYAWVNR